MCGLFAIIPSAHSDPAMLRSMFREFAYLNDSRGGDSWGLWGREQGVIHGMGKAHKEGLGTLTNVAKYWTASEGNWLAGHTRYGTHGKNVIENAHPFHVKGKSMEIMLAHNGVVTVSGYRHVHPVDSCQIAQALADEGFSAMKLVRGSCALLVSQDDHLLAYRSKQVLSMAYGGFGWLISSEARHLCKVMLDHKQIPSLIEAVPEDAFVAPWDSVRIEAPSCKSKDILAEKPLEFEQLEECCVCGYTGICTPRLNKYGEIEWVCDLCDTTVLNDDECDDCGGHGARYYGKTFGYLCSECAQQIGLGPVF